MQENTQKKEYLSAPQNESCYEYLIKCCEKITADVGDYPVLQSFGCDMPMAAFRAEVERLAAKLTEMGFKKNDVLSVFLPTCSHAVVVFYTLSKLGIIADFIHPLTPPAGLQKTMQATRSKGVFLLNSAAEACQNAVNGLPVFVCSLTDHTTGAVKTAMKAAGVNIFVPEKENFIRYADLLRHDLPPVPDAEKDAKETAVYMHGSGTTGKSKTVQLSAFALNSSAYSQYQIDKYHDYGHSYSLAVLPVFHAFGLAASVHYATCNAYTPILMPKFDAVQANEIIAKNNVQYISGAPSMFRKLYSAENFENPGLKNLTCLYSGGDLVSEAFIKQFNAVLKKNGSVAKLFRGWGLTEMSAVCSTNAHDNHRATSIGKLGFGMELKIIDEDGRALPAGEQGEICLTGDTMMNGYLPEENVTETGLFPDENGVNWVHTGDMGFVDEDGYLYFTGRKKRIIIISGYNIYPYSIEQQITALPFVMEACAVQGYLGEKPIVKLCVSLQPDVQDEEVAKQMILAYCKENFNRFSVPRKIIVMPALPRTKMDKLDFLAMTDPLPAGLAAQR
ncbi:MAG: acyl--CoA ligase [Clostridia bacterium]|nr:acyl--CoA ligase [Clostridia bacterium]